jgi:Tfp pilus assembly protein PilE
MRTGDMGMREQTGLSMIGFLFVAAVVVVVAIIGFRMVPSYVEYFTIQKAVEQSLRSAPDPQPAVVRKAFEKYIAADYIESVRPSDLQIEKIGNNITASVTWQKQLHMVGNVSLLLDFDVSATR